MEHPIDLIRAVIENAGDNFELETLGTSNIILDDEFKYTLSSEIDDLIVKRLKEFWDYSRGDGFHDVDDIISRVSDKYKESNRSYITDKESHEKHNKFLRDRGMDEIPYIESLLKPTCPPERFEESLKKLRELSQQKKLKNKMKEEVNQKLELDE